MSMTNYLKLLNAINGSPLAKMKKSIYPWHVHAINFLGMKQLV